MDFSSLPDIFALTIFIVGFRPLVRRVGPHVNLWFLGLAFILLHYFAQLFSNAAGRVGLLAGVVAFLAFDLCALSFLLAAANEPKRRIGRVLLLEFAVPTLLASLLFALQIKFRAPYDVTCLLFVVPAVHLRWRSGARSRPMVLISAAFAVFGVLLLPRASAHPDLVAYGALSLLLLSAAYLYLSAASAITRGVVTATLGLAAWAGSFLLALMLLSMNPAAPVSRRLLELPIYLVAAGITLTLLEQQLQRTERMAMHDPLTDLPNRRLFEERLIATMEEARLNRTTVACLVIDVDNFKTINDTLGHSAGDQLLRSLAVRLSWHMSPRDILARTGGDEFTALLAGVTDEHHLRFIAGAMMSAGSVPIAIEGQSVDVQISIGIALSPDDADDIDGLRRAADEAMYSAKRRGGGMLAFAGEQ